MSTAVLCLCLAAIANGPAGACLGGSSSPPAVRGLATVDPGPEEPDPRPLRSAVEVEIRHHANGAATAVVRRGDEPMILELVPHSIRARGFELLVCGEDGVARSIPAGPERTVRGLVAGVPGSIVAGAILDDGLHATIRLPDRPATWIEPVTGPDARAGAHLVYLASDVPAIGAVCGVGHLGDVARGPGRDRADGAGGVAGGDAPPLFVTELAVDSDHSYFQDYGESEAAVQDKISLVINTMNAQYETEVGISFVITSLVVRTSPGPYANITQMAALICRFISQWTTDPDLVAIERDVAELFSGKQNLTGSLGLAADIGSICDPDPAINCAPQPPIIGGSYCAQVSDFMGAGRTPLACSTDLSAHELGHLWSAVHCSGCRTTMNPNVPCANTFGPEAVKTIVEYREALATYCLDATGQLRFSFPAGRPEVLDVCGGTMRRDRAGVRHLVLRDVRVLRLSRHLARRAGTGDER